MTDTKHTPAPLVTQTVFDGRHHYLPIMAKWHSEENKPYHPLIATVLHGRGNAPREVAEATAKRMVLAYNLHDELLEALKAAEFHLDRLGFAADEPQMQQVRAAIAKAEGK